MLLPSTSAVLFVHVTPTLMQQLKGNKTLKSFFTREIIAVLSLCRAVSFVRCLFPDPQQGSRVLQPPDDKTAYPFIECARLCVCWKEAVLHVVEPHKCMCVLVILEQKLTNSCSEKVMKTMRKDRTIKRTESQGDIVSHFVFWEFQRGDMCVLLWGCCGQLRVGEGKYEQPKLH